MTSLKNPLKRRYDEDEDDDKTIPDIVPEDCIPFNEEEEEEDQRCYGTDIVPVYNEPNKHGVHRPIHMENLIDAVRKKRAAWNVTAMVVKRQKTRLDSWITDWEKIHRKYGITIRLTDIEAPRKYHRLVYADYNGLPLTKKFLQNKKPYQKLYPLVPFPTTTDMVILIFSLFLHYILTHNHTQQHIKGVHVVPLHMFEYLNSIQYFSMKVALTFIMDLRTRSPRMPFDYYYELKTMINGCVLPKSQIIVYMYTHQEQCFNTHITNILKQEEEELKSTITYSSHKDDKKCIIKFLL